MCNRSRAATNEACSADPVKPQLNFSADKPSNELDTDFLREPIWKTSRGHRVDFLETNPSVQFRCLDLLPATQIDSGPVAAFSCKEPAGKTVFTDDQKAVLEAKFRRMKYPNRTEKAKLASKLGLGIRKVQNWFINRRRKWKKEQSNGAAGPSGLRAVLPGVSLTQTSCKRSFKSTMAIGCFPQLPAQRQDVSPQPLPSAPLIAAVPFASASHHVTQSFQSYTARSTGTKLCPQQPLAIHSQPLVTGTENFPYQQFYSPFSGPVEIVPQQNLESNRLIQETAATSYLTHYSPPSPVKPVELDFHQLPTADPRHLSDELTFACSISNELPNIFEYLEDDEDLETPLTPFEPPTELEPWLDSMALQSDLYHNGPGSLAKNDFIDNISPVRRHAQSSNLNSCCFSSSHKSSTPQLTELSCGLISKGRSFSFYRQD